MTKVVRHSNEIFFQSRIVTNLTLAKEKKAVSFHIYFRKTTFLLTLSGNCLLLELKGKTHQLFLLFILFSIAYNIELCVTTADFGSKRASEREIDKETLVWRASSCPMLKLIPCQARLARTLCGFPRELRETSRVHGAFSSSLNHWCLVSFSSLSNSDYPFDYYHHLSCGLYRD